MRLLLLLGVTFAATFAFAEIRETNSIKEIYLTAMRGDLVVFDLDNTIMQPATAVRFKLRSSMSK